MCIHVRAGVCLHRSMFKRVFSCKIYSTLLIMKMLKVNKFAVRSEGEREASGLAEDGSLRHRPEAEVCLGRERKEALAA